ncbi:MAG: hypothetical protein U0790_26715 [Isosphaeraceae bacterium]
MSRRAGAIALITFALLSAGLADGPFAQGTQDLRPGLTAQQTLRAVELARGALTELRKKTEGAAAPDVDRREYIVGVEFLSAAPPAARTPDRKSAAQEAKAKAAPGPESPKGQGQARENPPRKPGPFAVVTAYRYFDDITVFSTIDLGTGRVVDVQAAQHLRSALSDEEFEEAKAMARERSGPVKELYARFGDKLTAYPQFSQSTVKGDPRIHRVIHLTYRVGTRDLSYPRPVVDLTTRSVETPGPEVFPQPRRR